MQPIVLIIILLSTAAAFAKSESKLVLEQSKQIEKAANDIIWPGFRALNYSRFEESDRSLRFEAGKTFSWKIAEKYYREHTLAQNISITFHEAFHAFQRDIKRPGRKWGYENAMLLFRYQESSARNAALFAIEAELLREAIEVKDSDALRAKLAEFLAVRNLRQSELPPKFAEFETGAELNEGLAEYAGVRAVTFAIDNMRELKFKHGSSLAYLSSKYQMLSRINEIGKNVRLKFYYTGSAQGVLLDRIYPGWKQRIQFEGKTVQQLLAEKVTGRRSVSGILKSRNYNRILENEKRRVSKRKAENRQLLEKTLNAAGIQLTIDHAGLARRGGIKFFDPMNVTMVDSMTRVHTRSVTFHSPDNFEVSYSAPVVEDLKNHKYISVISEYPEFVIDGKPVKLRDGLRVDAASSTKMTVKGMKLSAKGGTITVRGKLVLVRLK